jgi:hypothetical protein
MTRLDERPIIFSAPMVRAILEGRKTQTRRVIKPQPTVNKFGTILWTEGRADSQIAAACPYGYCQPGPTGIHPRLWVRETFCYADFLVDGYSREDPTVVAYRADHSYRRFGCAVHNIETDGGGWNWEHTSIHWKPSIFMPRWASRITLEITNVRVQRVQEISEEDALAEGIWPPCPESFHEDVEVDPATVRYASLWDDINLKRGYGFNSNPWVWAISFRRLP